MLAGLIDPCFASPIAPALPLQAHPALSCRRLTFRACPRCPRPAGSGPYSTARWNPQGRFLVLAGIGNLPGDLAFFDKKADGKCRSMGNTRWVRATPGGGCWGVLFCWVRDAVLALAGTLASAIVVAARNTRFAAESLADLCALQLFILPSNIAATFHRCCRRAENAVTAEWSPCGRYLLTATIAPRMRVDNGFQVRACCLNSAPRACRAIFWEGRMCPLTCPSPLTCCVCLFPAHLPPPICPRRYSNTTAR